MRSTTNHKVVKKAAYLSQPAVRSFAAATVNEAIHPVRKDKGKKRRSSQSSVDSTSLDMVLTCFKDIGRSMNARAREIDSDQSDSTSDAGLSDDHGMEYSYLRDAY